MTQAETLDHARSASLQTSRSGQPILVVNDLVKHFSVKGGLLKKSAAKVLAVDGVSFEVDEGETLGIVGESGCGKSTTARVLMRLMEPDSGEIIVKGRPVGSVDGMSIRDMRYLVQMVFQDSYASLNPRMTIEETIAFGPRAQGVSLEESRQRARDLLGRVGLDPNLFIRRYPHELSGGQRQRVNIARALALQPELLILDEAVSALDKSVEAQVLNLLMDLKESLRLTYIFISHDLNVVHYVSDRVLVMYLGKVVEIGKVEDIYSETAHPYTRALLSAMPSMDPDQRASEPPISGDPPNPINPPSGCRFHTRCAFAEPMCAQKEPKLHVVSGRARHFAACHMIIPNSGHSAAKRSNDHA
ncbi:MAG: ABC transporter ATP-binding protein [Hyphomicrobiaceae bacterium]